MHKRVSIEPISILYTNRYSYCQVHMHGTQVTSIFEGVDAQLENNPVPTTSTATCHVTE